MSGSHRKRGDVTREAILAAAETCFAQHGFAGARIDTIAETSGFNKALIFRYFGDKLGLYTAMLRRSDQELSVLLARVFAPLMDDATITSDGQSFRAFLHMVFGEFFDYMVEHPNFTRIINWEQADGWATYTRIASQFETDDLARLEAIFATARAAGVIRPDIDIVMVVILAYQICWSSSTALPMYQPILAHREWSSNTALAHLRAQVIAFIVAGIMNDAHEPIASQR